MTPTQYNLTGSDFVRRQIIIYPARSFAFLHFLSRFKWAKNCPLSTEELKSTGFWRVKPFLVGFASVVKSIDWASKSHFAHRSVAEKVAVAAVRPVLALVKSAAAIFGPVLFGHHLQIDVSSFLVHPTELRLTFDRQFVDLLAWSDSPVSFLSVEKFISKSARNRQICF